MRPENGDGVSLRRHPDDPDTQSTVATLAAPGVACALCDDDTTMIPVEASVPSTVAPEGSDGVSLQRPTDPELKSGDGVSLQRRTEEVIASLENEIKILENEIKILESDRDYWQYRWSTGDWENV